MDYYYSLYGDIWNAILQSRTRSLCSEFILEYSEMEPAAEDNLRAGLIVIEAWFRGY